VRKPDGSVSKTFIKPGNLLMPAGTAVCVCGVTGAPELNGRVGVAGSWSAEKGRYAVVVEGRAKPAGLRPENVRALLFSFAAGKAAEGRPGSEWAGLTRDEDGHEAEVSGGGGGREENFWKARAEAQGLAEARAAALREMAEAQDGGEGR
jgi:hypothetical protein